jgi:hypothetical protein
MIDPRPQENLLWQQANDKNRQREFVEHALPLSYTPATQ